MNTALSSLEYAAPIPHPKCQQPLTLACLPRHSLAGNPVTGESNIGGAEGAKRIADALKVNSALTALKCVAPRATFLIWLPVSVAADSL